MKPLEQIYNEHKKGDWPDKNSTHSYIGVYEELLMPYRNTAKNILEIGLMSGESLRMWTEYFSGDVYGMDCSETPIDGLADLRPIIAEGFKVCIGDATSAADIDKFFEDIKFDVVIDDGNHITQCQVQTFEILKNKMNEGGMYIIEDISDIDNEKFTYLLLHKNVHLVDLRKIKNRFDDVLAVIRF